MVNKDNTLFLLGGHDLEMLTIRHILVGAGYPVMDRNLSWGARLSSYGDVLHRADTHLEYVFGIELIDDLLLDDTRYHPIDHHNADNHSPGALEQVSALIGHTLTDEEKLIAANDTGYIPAMAALGASREVMEDIRLRDRKAQGVTEEDEDLATASISRYLERIGNTLVARSLTPHFSAICDRLFPFLRLLVFNDEEWTFYGEGKSALTLEFAPEIAGGRIYHGGGENGYIGAAKGAFTMEEINRFVSTFKDRYEYA